VLRNVGAIENKGLEGTLNATVVRFRQFGWEATLNAAYNANKVLTLGLDESGLPNKTIGTGATRDSVGLPINAQFYRKYTYADANNDGYIVASEVAVDPNFSYIGSANPKKTISLANTFSVLNNRLRINAQFDYKGDYFVLDNNGSFRCVNLAASGDRSDPTTPLDRQAACVAARATSTTTSYGYFQSGEFIRFRELSATFAVPQSLMRRVRGERASLSLGARNLHIWTDFTGQDPEANYSTGDVQANIASSAPRTYYTARLNLFF
jgi:hypothetical protein